MKKHYEKVIVACCFLTLFTNTGFASTSFNIYQPYIVALPNIGDTGGSFILSVRTLVSLLCMFVVGKYYQLLDCRLGAALACCCTGAGFIVFSQSGDMGGFCFGAVLTGVGYGLGGMVATTMLVGRWFKGHLGSALGAVAVGSGAAGLLVPLAAAQIIAAFSLSASFFVEGCAAICLGLVVFLLLRNRPEDMGLAPYEGKPRKNSSRPMETVARPLEGRRMGAMLFGMFLLGCIGPGGACYFGVLISSEGIDAMTTAFLVALMGGCLMVAKAVNGYVFDRLGTRRGTLVFFLMMGIGFVCCCLVGVGGEPMAFAAAVLYGSGNSLSTVGISMWSLELAPVLKRPQVIKNFQMCYALGAFAINAVPAVLKQSTGTYITSYVVMLALTIMCAAIVLHTYRVSCEPLGESAES